MKTLVGILLSSFCIFGHCADEPISSLPEKTTVSATADVPHRLGQNLIWCNSFQLAWNALGTGYCGEPLHLNGAQIFEKAMNDSSVSDKDVDADSVLVKVGKLTPDFADELNAELQKKFGDSAPPKIIPPANSNLTVMAYAYLFKSLVFAKPFDKRIEPLGWRGSEGENSPIQAFGLIEVGPNTSRDLMKQVQIISYTSSECIIELKTKSEKDHLILARIEPKATLKATVDAVRQRVANPERAPFAIQVSDHCVIPCVQIALERIYDEILEKQILNEKLQGYSITKAQQRIRLNLDEKGVALKSEAEIHAYKNGHSPRRIVFDRPFLLYLEREHAANPYLAIWFENPNLFVKGKGKPKQEPVMRK